MAELIGNTLIKLSSVDSTNNYATAHMTNNNWNEGTVVLAEEQYAGRGQVKNKWESEAGANLLFSIVLYPDFLAAHSQFLLSKVVALGIVDTLNAFLTDVKIKWPNDIYVGSNKIAGILVENSIMGNTLFSSVVGIGLNVNQLVFVGDAPNPISIRLLSGRETNLDALRDQLFESIERWYSILKSGDFAMIDEHYLNELYRLNYSAYYKDKDGIYSGTLIGVNESGQLLIRDEKGAVRCYHFKEVEFIL